MTQDGKWSLALVVMGLGLLGASHLREILPASYYYEQGEMLAYDVNQGECPVLDYHRDINNAFHGEWLVSVRQQSLSGGWILVPPTWKGEQDYRTDAVLPDPLTFEWWVWDDSVVCDWEPGVYKITTQITINPENAPKFVRIDSTPFRVLPQEPEESVASVGKQN